MSGASQIAADRFINYLNPVTLLVDVNLRANTTADKDFVASLKQFGVLQPIVGVLTADGQVRVRFGHRRVLGAIEAGLATVPVVVAGDEGTDKEATIERLLTQYAENEHRSGLTKGETVDVVEQLRLLDVAPAAIAKKTRLKRGDVDHAIAIAQSGAAKIAHEQHSLTLGQAAGIAEFDGDPATVDKLVLAASRGHFDHALASARQRRVDAKALAMFTEKLTVLGVPIIETPTWGQQPHALKRLTTLEGVGITVEQHADCPGHVVWADEDWAYFRPDGSVIEDQDEIDRLDEQDEPTDVDWKRHLTPVYGCSDPGTHGHLVDGHAPKTSGAATANMPVDERLAAEEAAAELRSAERRMVIANNKAWDVAEPVRQLWVKENLARRKTLPKAAGALMATTLTTDTYMLNGCSHLASTYGFLPDNPSTWLKGASETRAQVVTLMLFLTAYEAFTDRTNWRSKPTQTERYLLWLQDQGYALSDVERMAAKLPLEESTQAPTSGATQRDGSPAPVLDRSAGGRQQPEELVPVAPTEKGGAGPAATGSAPPALTSRRPA